MSELLFYGVKGGKIIGPYHPDELGARMRAVAFLRRAHRGRDVFMVHAHDYTDARRKLER